VSELYRKSTEKPLSGAHIYNVQDILEVREKAHLGQHLFMDWVWWAVLGLPEDQIV